MGTPFPHLSILADDLTGAADCAVAFARTAHVEVRLGAPDGSAPRRAGVVAYDLDTRDAPAASALSALERALAAVGDRGVRVLKIDSTLRGHIEDGVAAMARAGGAGPVIVNPAFPALGRTFEGGCARLGGVLVEETAFGRSQHLAPGASDLSARLAARGLRVAPLSLATVRGGGLSEAIRAADCDILLPDAVDERDLDAIARAALDVDASARLVGSGGIARGLAPLVAGAPEHGDDADFAGPILWVIGSATGISRTQAARIECGERVVASPSGAIAPPDAARLAATLAAGGDAIVTLSPATGGDGLDPALLDAMVAGLPAMLPTGASLVLTGGATARRILTAYGVAAVRLIGEIEPGVPFGEADGPAGPLRIVLKAGGFGTDDTFVRIGAALHARPSKETHTMTRPTIAITMGDPAGIGPEVIAKSLARPELFEICQPVIVGDADRIAYAARAAGIAPPDFTIVEAGADLRDPPGPIPLVEACAVGEALAWGAVSPVAGQAAYDCIAMAVDLAVKGAVDAIATAPISKEALHAAGHKFPGHTELIGSMTGASEVSMMLTTPKLRVIHVTTHIGLIDAIAKIEPGLVLRTIERGRKALLKMLGREPRIGVCAINPHAGEHGLFGHGEEAEKIEPAIAEANAAGWDVTGPLAADTLFFRAARGDFDLVVAMYHDQGHGPVKVMGLDEGVNVSVGLPIIRTSVDHGTAFDIAGKGIADDRSLIAALREASVLTGLARDA
ncbi:4-hydroxythreonine-4-phosphate dehydrogenase PdxA [Acuticoccus sp. M5D2P5]|uniref:4-hydroxythreonine-4-phosphate dehydrogenase PdxA n=1 Tax=Acuticoccus kalidii TaxID=2910977 RepID=UPI001F17F149|nr:4-hydroxythreonine-4-phosphate dehydrogenase PdxA [Acuticoccus kalidii]MCF3935479.1 4-hydroxythreonine-4-phosphate dehydrogenase PdxA [Acuticoccus kalidii]